MKLPSLLFSSSVLTQRPPTSAPTITRAAQRTFPPPLQPHAPLRRSDIAFYAAAAIGLLLRLDFIFAANPHDLTFHSGGSDSPSYVLLAQNLLHHLGFAYDGFPTAVRPPGYPLLLAAAMQLFGAHYILAIRILQFALGLATIAICANVAQRLATPSALPAVPNSAANSGSPFAARSEGRSAYRAALLIGLFLPTLIFTTAQLLTECVAALLTAIFLQNLVRQRQLADTRSAWLMGAAAGIESMFRFNAAALPIFAAAAVFASSKPDIVRTASATNSPVDAPSPHANRTIFARSVAAGAATSSANAIADGAAVGTSSILSFVGASSSLDPYRDRAGDGAQAAVPSPTTARPPSRALRLTLALLLPLLIVSPWLLRNERAFHGQVLYSTQSGPNAVQGVLTSSGRTQPGDSELLQKNLGWELHQIETNSPTRANLPGEAVLDRAALAIVPKLWAAQGLHAIPLLAKKLADFWLSADQLVYPEWLTRRVYPDWLARSGPTASLPQRERILRAAGVLSYWLVLAAALLGYTRLRHSHPAIATLFLLYASTITVLHLPLVMNTRLRIPLLDPLLVILASQSFSHAPRQDTAVARPRLSVVGAR